MKISTRVPLIITFILLGGTALGIALESVYPWFHIVRMVMGSVSVLFVPGYWITRWAFPPTGGEPIIDPTSDQEIASSKEDPDTIDGLERFVLSVALSISTVPLLLFYVNFLGVPLTIWSVYVTICVVTLISLGGVLFLDSCDAKKSS